MPRWLRSVGPLFFALISVVTALWAVRLNIHSGQSEDSVVAEAAPSVSLEDVEIDLPDFITGGNDVGVNRKTSLVTIFPDRPRMDVILYTVESGDSVFGIAERFGLKPESILWGNYEVLNDDPHMLRVGQELNVLPVNGVYYQWQESDNLESIADEFLVEAREIIDWPGNRLNPADLEIETGTWLVIPGGQRALRQWFVPTIARGSAGVGKAYGPGGCSGDYSGGAVGSGGFIWPTANHTISGNDYWSGHLAIDIAAGTGAQVWAADAGVVVFAGWAYGGYGNMVMIDHGNGWQTVYAHLSQVLVACGQSVGTSSTIGLAGSTGNSTGPHLHFEIRYFNGFVNPWYVLP
ncbi:MAG: peptidoglycan DD-metalloendopeptidase family protein [Anaerolineales bacterium]|nr:peptidoglycan DD-metalloendopeptidase family protein [Anaerolineales bacterium]